MQCTKATKSVSGIIYRQCSWRHAHVACLSCTGGGLNTVYRLPNSQQYVFQSCSTLCSNSKSWASHAVGVPSWLPPMANSTAHAYQSDLIATVVEIASDPTVQQDLRVNKYSALETVMKMCQVLSVCPAEQLQRLESGDLAPIFNKHISLVCQNICTAYLENPPADSRANDHPLKALSAVARLSALLPWCTAAASCCHSLLALLRKYLQDIRPVNLCDLAQALADLKIDDTVIAKHIFDSVVLHAPTMSSSDLQRTSLALLLLNHSGRANVVCSLVSLTDQFIAVDSTLSHDALFKLCYFLHQCHHLSATLDAFQRLSSAAVSELSVRTTPLFPQFDLLGAYHNCLPFLSAVPADTHNLVQAVWSILPSYAMSLSFRQLDLICQIIVQDQEHMHLNALHPQLYASIAYHLVANMTVMPPQLVVRLLRSLKEFKVLDHTLSSTVASVLCLQLPHLNPEEICQLLHALLWQGHDTDAEACKEALKANAALYSLFTSWLSAPSAGILQSIKLTVAPSCARRVEEFSTTDLRFLVFVMAQHGHIDEILLKYLMQRPAEQEWSKLMQELFVLSEASFQNISLPSAEKSLRSICTDLLSSMEALNCLTRFTELCNCIIDLRGLPVALRRHNLLEALLWYIDTAKHMSNEASGSLADGLETGWKIVRILLTEEQEVTTRATKAGDVLQDLLWQISQRKRKGPSAATWTDELQDTVLLSMLEMNSHFQSSLQFRHISAIAHLMLGVEGSITKHQYMHLLGGVTAIVQGLRNAAQGSIGDCSIAILASCVEVLYTLQVLGKDGKVNFQLDQVVFEEICRCACLLVGSEKRIDSPAIVMNMFYLLPKLHSPPGFFWKAFAELVKGPIVHLDLSMAVDLSVLFASHDCRNDALLVQVRSMLDKQGGGHSLRPDQKLQLPQILLRQCYPPPFSAEKAALSALEPWPPAVSLSDVTNCLRNFTHKCYVPASDVSKAFSGYLQKHIQQGVLPTEAALILDCMLFFESCSHSVDGLAGVSCAIATEMMNHFESLDPASQVSLPGWLVALNFTIGGFTRESWTKFSLKENVLSVLANIPLDAKCWSDLLYIYTATLPTGDKTPLESSPQVKVFMRQLVTAALSSSRRHLESLQRHLEEDKGLQMLDSTLLEYIKDPSLLERDVVTESFVPVWRAFYLDAEGQVCDPLSLDPVDNCSLAGYLDEAEGDDLRADMLGSRSANSENFELMCPVMKPLNGKQHLASRSSKIKFARQPESGVSRYAILPMRPGIEITSGRAFLPHHTKLMDRLLRDDGWHVFKVPLQVWLNESEESRCTAVRRFVLHGHDKKTW